MVIIDTNRPKNTGRWQRRMFASFKADETGSLIPTPPVRRQTRSRNGCLPCRRKRKACDKTKPACLLCRNSTGRDECVWPEQTSPGRKKLTATKPSRPRAEGYVHDGEEGEPSSPQNGSNVVHDDDHQTTWETSIVPLASSLPPGLGELSPTGSLTEVANELSNDMSYSAILRMTTEFQHLVLLPETGSNSPFLLQGLSAAQAHPALWHAWLASSIATLAPRESSYWQHKGLQHHEMALRGLRQSVLESSSDQEWRRGTMLMLHIYQLHNPADALSGELYIAHLTAAHVMFGEAIYTTPPEGRHAALLLEAYILRTSINYLFRPKWRLPRSHIRSRLDLLKLGLHSESELEQICPWIGPVTFRLIEIVYQLSWLAHELPLSTSQSSQIASILHDLESLHMPTIRATYVQLSSAGSSRDPAVVRGSYVCACAHLASVLIGISSTEGAQANNDEYIVLGTALISMAMDRNDDALLPLMVWPTVILGTGASSKGEQDLYRAALQELSRTSGREAISRVMSMLEDVWSARKDFSQRRLSTRILKDIITRYRVFL